MARRGTSPVLFLTFGLVAALAWQSGVGSLPVAAQSASPVAATEETLLEITIPPDLLPQGDRILSELIYITAPGGSTASWQEIHYADWPGLRVHHLLIGSLSVRAEGAAQVVRAGGASVEDVPAGVEAVLRPGDTWPAMRSRLKRSTPRRRPRTCCYGWRPTMSIPPNSSATHSQGRGSSET